jgi:hypothetical protein
MALALFVHLNGLADATLWTLMKRVISSLSSLTLLNGTIPQKKVMVQTGLLNYLPPLQRGIEGDLTPWQTCAL